MLCKYMQFNLIEVNLYIYLLFLISGPPTWWSVGPSLMPARKGLLAPQNTFLDTIATRFDGTREFNRFLHMYNICLSNYLIIQI